MLSIVRCWRSKRGTCDEKGERERQKSQHVLKRHPNALSANQRSKFLLLLFLSGSPYLTSQNCGITWRGISLKVAITISIVNHNQKGWIQACTGAKSTLNCLPLWIFKFGAFFSCCVADSESRRKMTVTIQWQLFIWVTNLGAILICTKYLFHITRYTIW